MEVGCGLGHICRGEALEHGNHIGLSGLDHYISFHLSQFFHSEKNWRNQLVGYGKFGPSLENWGLKPSRAIFEASKNLFGGKKILRFR
jgi:hypothetical protein